MWEALQGREGGKELEAGRTCKWKAGKRRKGLPSTQACRLLLRGLIFKASSKGANDFAQVSSQWGPLMDAKIQQIGRLRARFIEISNNGLRLF